ncbi:MAG: DivIVA domain-containing protein [Acidobacteriota bacterium]
MSLTPLDIRKMDFPRKMRGLDPDEVADFLQLVADELAARLGDIARLQQENQSLSERLGEAMDRQQELQEALLHAQKISKDITDHARREADVLIREGQIAADDMVNQAIEQAGRIESKTTELRTMRRELHLKLRNSLELFGRILEADMEDERSTAIVRTLKRRKTS